MKTRGIVQDQKVTGLKVILSRIFRKSMTPAESVFWEMSRKRKICGLKFRRQQVIDGFIVDFFCNEAGLVVEIEGSVHGNKDQRLIDHERECIFRRRGLKVLHFSNNDVLYEPDYVIKEIQHFVSTPPSPMWRGSRQEVVTPSADRTSERRSARAGG